MTHKWQIVLLSAAVSYGSGLVAMDTKKENKAMEIAASNRSTKNPLSCSAELRTSQPIIMTTENRMPYCGSPCGSGRSSSPEFGYYNNNIPMNVRMAPVSYYPGQ